MGFLSSKSEEEPKLPPNKARREACWTHRDLFFECLSQNEIDNSLDPKESDRVEKHCGTQRKSFQDNCVASWYKYFQEKRYNDLLRARYIEKLEAEGAKPLPFKLGPRT